MLFLVVRVEQLLAKSELEYTPHGGNRLRHDGHVRK
jgi:hypothetical protein